MMHLLKIEWMKIKNYKVFLIIAIFFTIGILLSNYIVYSVFDNMINNSTAAMLLDKFNPYDLYSKVPVAPDAKALRPYYEDLVAKFLPATLKF